MNDYTGEQLHEYFLQSPPEVQKILLSDDLETTATVLGKLYKLPVDKYLTLKNIITLILLGLIVPDNVISELEKNISIDNQTALSLAKDLNESILQETRVRLFGGNDSEIKVLQIKDTNPTKELLREELMSRTKQDLPVNKIPSEIPTMPTKEARPSLSVIASSHDQLLDQLQVIETLPKDAEVEERLAKIREQVEYIQNNKKAEMKKEEEAEEKETVALAVEASNHKPIFPEHYNIDPYREMVEAV